MPDMRDTTPGGPKALRTRSIGITFWLPLVWMVFVACCAVCADWLDLPAPDKMDWANLAAFPGAKGMIPAGDSQEELPRPRIHLLGTDTLGRDILTRLIYGARASLTVGFCAPFIGLLVGGGLGMLAAFYRGRLDIIITAAMDTILAFPGMVLILAVTFYLGVTLLNLTAVLGLLLVPAFCRVARANTLAVSEREFVTAARALGASDSRILIHEILPNILMPLIVYGLLLVAVMIVVEGALSFLGLGVPAPAPSWGGMIAGGREVLEEAPHVSLIPAFVMSATVLSVNLIADTIRGLKDSRNALI